MSKTYSKTRTLVECALMIALGTVLANIKIFEMPNGGSITLLSMLPFILVSYRHGTKWGLFTGFVNSLLQMLLGFYAPPAPGLLPLVGMILLDYVLAFTLLGLAGAIAKPFKNRLVGVASTFTNTSPISSLRISHTFSCVISAYFGRKSFTQSACFSSPPTEETSFPLTRQSARLSISFLRREGSTASPITSIRPIFSFLM